MLFLLRPGLAEAIAEVMRAARPTSGRGPQRPSASARPAPWRALLARPGRALAFVIYAETVVPRRSHTGGERQCLSFSARPAVAEAIAKVMRKPIPIPAGSGAGLCR